MIDSRTDESISGATLLANRKDASVGVTTDIDGEFTLKVSEHPAIIAFRYLCYRLQEIDVYEFSGELMIPLLLKDRTHWAKCRQNTNLYLFPQSQLDLNSNLTQN